MAVDQVRQRSQPRRQAAQPVSLDERLRGLEDQLRRLPPERVAELEAALRNVRGPGADDDRMIAVFEQGARSAQHNAERAGDDMEEELDTAWREGYAEGFRKGAQLKDDLADAERTATELEEQVRAAQERVSELETELGEMEAREAELAGRERQAGRRGEGRAPSERERSGAGGS